MLRAWELQSEGERKAKVKKVFALLRNNNERWFTAYEVSALVNMDFKFGWVALQKLTDAHYVLKNEDAGVTTYKYEKG